MVVLVVVAATFWGLGVQAHSSQQLIDAVRSGGSGDRLDAIERFENSRSLRLIAPPALVRRALDAAAEDDDPEVARRARALRARLLRSGGREGG